MRRRRRTIAERRIRLWNQQNGLCGVCLLPLDYEETVVDHDHAHCDTDSRQACGDCDRGALHSSCNLLLGHANDNAELLEKAIQYLRRRAVRQCSLS
ncbi:MAG TPA: endonuclease domain-containing protein [Geobacteraceae bacterium]|nr:endonuclease domain-containing protein [Geobacteraceae bacterium]